ENRTCNPTSVARGDRDNRRANVNDTSIDCERNRRTCSHLSASITSPAARALPCAVLSDKCLAAGRAEGVRLCKDRGAVRPGGAAGPGQAPAVAIRWRWSLSRLCVAISNRHSALTAEPPR